MTENPYASPVEPATAIGVRSNKKHDIYKVAIYQKVILLNILVYFGLIASQFLFSQQLLLILFIINALIAFLFVIMLGAKVYHPVVGIIVGIIAIIPLIGLLALLSINGKATTVLKDNGFKVGLLGANLDAIKAWLSKEDQE